MGHINPFKKSVYGKWERNLGKRKTEKNGI